jgi:hypothetical protein
MSTSDPGPNPNLEADERAHLIRLLHDSENDFLELISGVTDGEWDWKAAPDRWSVAETAEHLVLGEKAMFGRIKQALAAPPNPDWAEQDARKTKFVSLVLPDRSRKAAAPASLEPHHHWPREETVARYKEGRARTLQFVAQLDQPVKDRSAEHPFPVFNMLNAYQWLLYIPLHNARHNQQIAEALKEFVR